jgi:hypothetical protein
MSRPNQSAANRRPAGQSDGSGSLAAIVAADRLISARSLKSESLNTENR